MSEGMELVLPAMYADHHVQRVRSVLLALAGVESVWASAAETRARVTYAAAELSPDAIREALASAGYPEGEPGARYDVQPGDRTAWQRSALRTSETHVADRQAAGDFRRY